jgi:hypothetical protein
LKKNKVTATLAYPDFSEQADGTTEKTVRKAFFVGFLNIPQFSYAQISSP